VVVGYETDDDAGVYKLREKEFIVQTADFITPVVDDPYTFGRIAAVNSLSDIYAMGAQPITALSLLMFDPKIESTIITAIMQGGADELAKAECSLIGGHTLDEDEIKTGFAVTGIIENGKIYKNCNLREGDLLVYTKPLGIGIITTAIKGELATESEISEVVDVMVTSNRAASEIMLDFDVSSCTDITGFGLAGHAYEMALGSKVTIEFQMGKIKILSPAIKYANMGIIPGGAYASKKFLEPFIDYKKIEKDNEMLVFDPQTSGGLLMGVSSADAEGLLETLIKSGYTDANIIGKVLEREDISIKFS